MTLALINDKDWLDKNCTPPFYITITGKPGNIVYDAGHFHEYKDTDDVWFQYIRKSIDEKFIAIDYWGGDTNPLTYEEIIEFIANQFAEIYEVKITNEIEENQKEEDRRNDIEDKAMFVTLQMLNNKVLLEEKTNNCTYCGKYIRKCFNFCNKFCERGDRKSKK